MIEIHTISEFKTYFDMTDDAINDLIVDDSETDTADKLLKIIFLICKLNHPDRYVCLVVENGKILDIKGVSPKPGINLFENFCMN